jgi:hypothetical protein
MDQAYLISLVEGFYPFGKRSKTGAKKQQSLVHSGDVYEQSSGVVERPLIAAANTGVERYLSARPVESGVSKYLKKNKSQPTTGVAKYLVVQSIKGREVTRITGVSKYLARFDSEMPASGVAKYVAKQIIKTKYLPKRTTVGRYIIRQEIAEAKLAALTGVAKYQAEQDLLQRRINAQKLIERYREEEARAAAEKAAAPAALQEMSAEYTQSAETVDVPAETRVGRYFQEKAKIESQKPTVSKVAKYIAQQVVRDSLRPRQSGVAKYLTKSRVYTPKPVVSGVAKYLEMQAQLDKTKPAYSGVAKYLIKQKLSIPALPAKSSGVTKYLAKHAQTISDMGVTVQKQPAQEFLLSGVAKYLNRQNDAANREFSQADVPVEICLEGEFIPADEVQGGDAVKPKNAKATRVSKYINEHQAPTNKTAVTRKPTGVDKYLLQSA